MREMILLLVDTLFYSIIHSLLRQWGVCCLLLHQHILLVFDLYYFVYKFCFLVYANVFSLKKLQNYPYLKKSKKKIYEALYMPKNKFIIFF